MCRTHVDTCAPIFVATSCHASQPIGCGRDLIKAFNVSACTSESRAVTLGFERDDVVVGIADGATVSAGEIELTAHYTPAHTPGSVAWTWRSCGGDGCLDVVFADSFSTRSAPEFRFTGGADYQGRIETFRNAIQTVAALPCDILLTPSPLSFGVKEKLAARSENPDTNPFIDSGACAAYAEKAEAGLEKRIAEEQTAQ